MKPDNIFLVRHGESVGNADKSVYKNIPDYALQLTDKGILQAEVAGKDIRLIIGPENPVQFYVSPFWRTRQTYAGIRQLFPDPGRYKYYEDPRIREQEWGQDMRTGREGYNNGLEQERDSYGHFYYRFRDGGESCADVFDRVSDFMNTMFRDFKKKDFPQNCIIVTHGMTMRLFLMRWFHCSVEEFESWANPKNGEFYWLVRGENEKYTLVKPLRRHVLKHPFQFKSIMEGDPLYPFPHGLLPYEPQ